jgi:hypothetical protein
MHVQERHRGDRISQLRLRSEVEALLGGACPVSDFARYFQEPRHFYSQGWPDKPADWPGLEAKELLPLWEHEDQIFALDFSCDPCEIISFYIEYPSEYSVYRSVDSAIFHMIDLHVWEYGYAEDGVEPARMFAERLRLPNRHRLNSLLDNWATCTEEMIDEYQQTLAP